MTQNAHIIPELEDVIRARAYQYWEEEGRPHGRHEIHWQRAVAYVTKPDLKLVSEMDSAEAAAVEDVTLIDGVGPKIEAALKSAGINKLSQIAAMTVKELEALDNALGFKGRSLREDWIGQAKDLVAGKPPRAKIDQAKASKK